MTKHAVFLYHAGNECLVIIGKIPTLGSFSTNLREKEALSQLSLYRLQNQRGNLIQGQKIFQRSPWPVPHSILIKGDVLPIKNKVQANKLTYHKETQDSSQSAWCDLPKNRAQYFLHGIYEAYRDSDVKIPEFQWLRGLHLLQAATPGIVEVVSFKNFVA